MRKILWFTEARFDCSALSYWQRTLQRLSALPSRAIEFGAEANFSAWLGKERAGYIRDLTEDELSRFLSGSPRETDVFRQRIPSEVFFQWATGLPCLQMSSAALEDCASVCSDIPDQRIRNFRNFSARDARGARQEFVTPAEVPRAIEEFCNVWNDETDIERSPIPIWLFVALLNAHPFGDGNGRLARTLLNVFLARNGLLGGHPIPLGPLIHATQGNFELAMGRAAIMNNWEPITKTFYLLVNFYADVHDEFWKGYDE